MEYTFNVITVLGPQVVTTQAPNQAGAEANLYSAYPQMLAFQRVNGATETFEVKRQALKAQVIADRGFGIVPFPGR